MTKTHNLPTPPTLWKTLGPSFILLGLALGSGELILWPYLAARYGLGLLWGAVLGVLFQFVLNTEAMRYTLYQGESVFSGFKKLHRWLPAWFIFSTFIPFAIPGFSSAAANIVARLIPGVSETAVAIFLLLFTGVLLTVGKSLYKTMEYLQKTIIFIGLPLIVMLTFWLASVNDWSQVAQGLVGIGQGWHFFPPAVAITAFLSAFAYAGAGGNLNLAQSYYIKEKGFGMGRYMDKISSLFGKSKKSYQFFGQSFPDTQLNRRRFKAWWQLVNREHLIVFFSLGLLTIILLSLLAFTTVFNSGQEITEGISFIYLQAEVINQQTIPFFGTAFLIMATMMLFGTQVGVMESSARIISENMALLKLKPGQQINLSKWFYASLWGQIILGIILYSLGFKEPRFLITLSAILNAAAMMLSFVFVSMLNKRFLRIRYRSGKLRQIIMAAAVLFFLFFLTLTVLG
ncbi:Nramp family divalent metal transporter [Patescibacteria group bacterium]|nr:Nramp family divalent metal transporter [Patescibacteria group bacterium]